MPSKRIHLDNIGQVTLTKRHSSKSIRISYRASGDIKVSLPLLTPYDEAIKFVKQNQEWLAQNKPAKQSDLLDGDRIGKAHRIAFNRSETAKRPSSRVTNTQIKVSLPAKISDSDPEVQIAVIRGAHKALTKESEQLLPQRLDQLAKKHGFTYASVSVKRLTSRWGSCNQSRDITLNIYLMQLPWNLIDYVIAHELTHTEHMNHSADFWQRLELAMPGAKDLRRALKNHRTVIEPIR